MTKDQVTASLPSFKLPLSRRSDVAPFMALDVLIGATRAFLEASDGPHLLVAH